MSATDDRFNEVYNAKSTLEVAFKPQWRSVLQDYSAIINERFLDHAVEPKYRPGQILKTYDKERGRWFLIILSPAGNVVCHRATPYSAVKFYIDSPGIFNEFIPTECRGDHDKNILGTRSVDENIVAVLIELAKHLN